ncbi:MAG: SMC-Scp complex subunit ScpB [candidate division Zixibacteria bacterium]|nr:SMC-Scp complex subunit ScpB [candidate division Zixibacteria bacterium]
MDQNGNRLPIIESLILSSPEPLSARRVIDVVDDISAADIEEIVTALNEKYLATDSSFRIRKVAGGYQLYIIEDYAGYVEELHTRRRNARLTRSALETLAIIAYRQPVTKLDIEMIRGVASDSVLHTLLERKLITLSGRAQTIGRPLLYRTTDEFLKYFNLNAIEDLPKMTEIEELLSSREPDAQQTLPLDSRDENEPLAAENTDEMIPPAELEDAPDSDTEAEENNVPLGDVNDEEMAEEEAEVIENS